MKDFLVKMGQLLIQTAGLEHYKSDDFNCLAEVKEISNAERRAKQILSKCQEAKPIDVMSELEQGWVRTVGYKV